MLEQIHKAKPQVHGITAEVFREGLAILKVFWMLP